MLLFPFNSFKASFSCLLKFSLSLFLIDLFMKLCAVGNMPGTQCFLMISLVEILILLIVEIVSLGTHAKGGIQSEGSWNLGISFVLLLSLSLCIAIIFNRLVKFAS